jgi:glycosyltransferase involved in cell wall biosynthesis
LKIVIIGTAYPLRGGIAHYVALLYRKLQERGHEVTVISFKRQYPGIFFPGKTQQDFSQDVPRIPSESLLDSINPISWLHTSWRVKQLRPDLLIFKYWMPFFAPSYATIAFLIHKFVGSKICFICDNITPHEKRIGDQLLNWIAMRAADCFIVQSTIVRDDLLQLRPDARFRQVPHPIYEIFSQTQTKEAARRSLGIGAKERILLFFGYVRVYKGLHCLLDAMPHVLSKLAARLFVVGEFYDDRQVYLDQITRLDLTTHVTVVDRYILNEEVGTYFMAADVVVLPYLSATQSGIVQIAYNYDRPVIVTAVGGLPEVVVDGKTGYIVPVNDPIALASAIVRFFEQGKGDELSRNVRAHKQQYSWERLAAAIEELVVEINEESLF